MYQTKAFQAPEGRAKAISSIIQLSPTENVETLLAISGADLVNSQSILFFITKLGKARVIYAKNFANIKKNGKIAINLDPLDELKEVILCKNPLDKIFVATKKGQGALFQVDQFRVYTHENTQGIKSINLGHGDLVAGAAIITSNEEFVLTVSSTGKGKLTDVKNYSTNNRNVKGVKIMSLKEGEIAGIFSVTPEQEIILTTSDNKILRCSVQNIPQMGRVTAGVKLVSLKKSENIKFVQIIP